MNSTGLRLEAFVANGLYCIDPLFLKHSLENSLKKMNIETLDVAILSYPAEVCRAVYGDA